MNNLFLLAASICFFLCLSSCANTVDPNAENMVSQIAGKYSGEAVVIEDYYVLTYDMEGGVENAERVIDTFYYSNDIFEIIEVNDTTFSIYGSENIDMLNYLYPKEIDFENEGNYYIGEDQEYFAWGLSFEIDDLGAIILEYNDYPSPAEIYPSSSSINFLGQKN